MAECYLDLGPGDRREVLVFAAGASGRPACLLEKDIWVVWALRTLFGASLGAPLVYARMFDDGLLPDDAEPFQALMSTREQIANRANR